MNTVGRYLCDHPRREVWLTTDGTSWCVRWGPAGGPWRDLRDVGETAARAWVADLCGRAGEWRDATHSPGP